MRAKARRLLWIAETFYTTGVTPWKESEPLVTPVHEICFYHLVDFDPRDPALSGPGPYRGHEGALLLEFRWFRRDELGSMTVCPRFLVEALRRLPASAIHVIDREGPDC